jgi:DNA-binding CsgD family transcriptional regulator
VAPILPKTRMRLTDRQICVLQLLCKGFRNAEIARYSGISERAVKSCLSQLFLILDVSNRTEWRFRVRRYWMSKLISLPPRRARLNHFPLINREFRFSVLSWKSANLPRDQVRAGLPDKGLLRFH